MDELRFNRAFGVLRRYSLMGRKGAFLRVHRLVQAVVRNSLPSEAWRERLSAALDLLQVTFPADVNDPEAWHLCAHLVAHVQTATAFAEGDSVVHPVATGLLLSRVASYLQVRGEYALARPHFERALKLDERTWGPMHPATAASLNNMGTVLKNQGDLKAARSYFERSLAICERVLGPDHPDTGASLDNLGLLLNEEGDLGGARHYMERSLAISEQVFGQLPQLLRFRARHKLAAPARLDLRPPRA